MNACEAQPHFWLTTLYKCKVKNTQSHPYLNLEPGLSGQVIIIDWGKVRIKIHQYLNGMRWSRDARLVHCIWKSKFWYLRELMGIGETCHYRCLSAGIFVQLWARPRNITGCWDKLGCHRWMKTNNWTNWEKTSNTSGRGHGAILSIAAQWI